ncbi:MAG: Glycogen synthase [Chlamydiae bacterium]|nr:Glycogen synthase [Chlamydiota bacterium]
MKIIYISSEISPIAKVGGLADVSLGLSRAVQALGNEVSIILPKYKCLKNSYLEHLKLLDVEYKVKFGATTYTVKVWEAMLHGLKLYLIDASSPKSFFDSPTIYGQRNDSQRFAFFSLASLEFISKYHSDTELLHINEWHTALAAPLYKEKYRYKFDAKIMFTIHNMNYQGVTGASLLKKVGLDTDKYLPQCSHPGSPTKINLIKTGICFSDYINTVSPKYYEEIKVPKNGHGLESLVQENEKKFTGILNGIDYEIWNPKLDKSLNTNYSFDHLENKYAAKAYLREHLKMPQTNQVPIVTCICRLVPQKGIRMIKHAIECTLKSNGQFILFGSSPIPKIQSDFEKLAKKHADNPNAQFIFDSYNEELSHQVYAGADMLICPSIFEPCGLTQLIALQYGTIPIVRQTGGLADTIFDIENHEDSDKLGNGFSYLPPTQKAIEQTLHRAFKIYFKNPMLWKRTIQRGMNMDFSWKNSAEKYFEIYRKLTHK